MTYCLHKLQNKSFPGGNTSQQATAHLVTLNNRNEFLQFWRQKLNIWGLKPGINQTGLPPKAGGEPGPCLFQLPVATGRPWLVVTEASPRHRFRAGSLLGWWCQRLWQGSGGRWGIKMEQGSQQRLRYWGLWHYGPQEAPFTHHDRRRSVIGWGRLPQGTWTPPHICPDP